MAGGRCLWGKRQTGGKRGTNSAIEKKTGTGALQKKTWEQVGKEVPAGGTAV